MQIEEARFLEGNTTIRVVIDGTPMFVPDSAENAQRQALALWEAGGGVIAAYEAPAPNLAAYAAERRWQVEWGGIVAGGVPISTDDRSKMMIGFAQARALADPNYTTGWKGADGTFVALDAAAVIAIANAVAAHVEACFAMEATVLAAIAEEEITTTAEIDGAFAALTGAA